MKKIYRGWYISKEPIEKGLMQAIKGKERIVGTEEQIRHEIDRRTFEEMRKDEKER